MLGDRFFGAGGALIALAGLLLAPLAFLVAAASFFTAFAFNADVRSGLFGATAAGAGLAIGTAVKMARKLPADPVLLTLGGATFLAAGFFRLPLPAILVVLLPAGLILGRNRR
jgi:chromate transporter